jgi:hypothetical protein
LALALALDGQHVPSDRFFCEDPGRSSTMLVAAILAVSAHSNIMTRAKTVDTRIALMACMESRIQGKTTDGNERPSNSQCVAVGLILPSPAANFFIRRFTTRTTIHDADWSVRGALESIAL